MSRKNFGFVLLCFLACILIPVEAEATESGICGDSLTWELNDSGILTISGTGDMTAFASYADQPWKTASFSTVIIEQGVTSIADYAFVLHEDLTDVTIPRSVNSIGRQAFGRCGLKNLSIPYGVNSIGVKAFQECSSLTSISFPDSLTTIGEHAFDYCTKLTSVFIPSSVTHIRPGVFCFCTNLLRIEVDSENDTYSSLDGVLIEKSSNMLHTFPAGRSGSYSIPNNVTNIHLHSFSGCDKLTCVRIPSSVTYIASAYFASCKSLKEIIVDTNNENAYSVNGILFTKNPQTILGYPGGLSKKFIVPSGVAEIAQATFSMCEKLTQVTMLTGVSSINNLAFYCCPNLEKVVIPATVKKVSSSAFSQCSSLKEVYYNGDMNQWKAIDGVKDAIRDSIVVHYQFTDVSPTAYYADSVNWAVASGITNGTTDETFSPGNICTTANIITFLWRAQGCPEPSIVNPFSDVQNNQYYAKAALWAYENKLISGNTFNGNSPCTRAATMKYLWILSGSPSSTSNPFTDVPNSASYAQAVSWAVAQGVTNGTTASTFAPDNTCTRGQIVTFLLRYYNR